MKRFALNFLICVMALAGLTSCVSGAKRLAQLDLAVSHPSSLDKLCLEGLSGACVLQGKTVVMGPRLPIMQGLTSAQQARFMAVVAKNQIYAYYIKSGKGSSRLAVERIQWPSSPMAVDQVQAFELDPRETYELIVIDDQGRAADRRQFRALDTAKKNPRLALVSCMDDSLKTEQAVMWKQLLSDKPDVILMIGDNVYADRVPGGWRPASPEQLWDRYADTRATLDFFKSPDLIPVLATWDDHDFGRNDSDRTNPVKESSARVFQAFFAQAQPTGEFTRGPGVASMWSAFGLRFLLLDDRSFRSPNRVDLPDQTHFGSDQEDWIVEQLNQAREPVFMVSGDQFFGGYHPFESYEGSHPKSFLSQVARWKKARAPLVFVSGDRHLTEILKVPRTHFGYQTYELTSSPMHAKVFAAALAKNPSPNQLVGVAGKYNYTILEVYDSGPKKVYFKVQSRGPDQATLYQRNLKVKK